MVKELKESGPDLVKDSEVECMGNIDLNDDSAYLFLKEETINKKEKTAICHLTQCKRWSEKVRRFDVWWRHLSLCTRRILKALNFELLLEV